MFNWFYRILWRHAKTRCTKKPPNASVLQFLPSPANPLSHCQVCPSSSTIVCSWNTTQERSKIFCWANGENWWWTRSCRRPHFPTGSFRHRDTWKQSVHRVYALPEKSAKNFWKIAKHKQKQKIAHCPNLAHQRKISRTCKIRMSLFKASRGLQLGNLQGASRAQTHRLLWTIVAPCSRSGQAAAISGYTNRTSQLWTIHGSWRKTFSQRVHDGACSFFDGKEAQEKLAATPLKTVDLHEAQKSLWANILFLPPEKRPCELLFLASNRGHEMLPSNTENVLPWTPKADSLIIQMNPWCGTRKIPTRIVCMKWRVIHYFFWKPVERDMVPWRSMFACFLTLEWQKHYVKKLR